MSDSEPLPDRIRKALSRVLRRGKMENATQVLPKEGEPEKK